MFIAFFVVFGPDIVFVPLLAMIWVIRTVFMCIMAIIIGLLELARPVAWLIDSALCLLGKQIASKAKSR